MRGPQVGGKFLISTHAPAGGATSAHPIDPNNNRYFYSRPCGRGDGRAQPKQTLFLKISTHAPAGGATGSPCRPPRLPQNFYSRPCGRGDSSRKCLSRFDFYFYSRPCGRGDSCSRCCSSTDSHFYSRPCGRGDSHPVEQVYSFTVFLLTPLREGRLHTSCLRILSFSYFYSRPCGRGDDPQADARRIPKSISTHAPAGGATRR